jgi:hypothetical protein
MNVSISCPFCEKRSKAPAEFLGKKVRCKFCDGIFVVEDNSQPASSGEVDLKPIDEEKCEAHQSEEVALKPIDEIGEKRERFLRENAHQKRMELHRSRINGTMPVVCVCNGCGIRYVLGVNAVVVTTERAVRSPAQKVEQAGKPFHAPDSLSDSSDSIALKSGEHSWPRDKPVPPSAVGDIPEVVRAAASGSSRRQWSCFECRTVNDYKSMQ